MITTVVFFEFFTTYTTLDPAAHSTDMSLSANLLTVTTNTIISGQTATARVTVAKSAGKFYLEFKPLAGAFGDVGLGFCNGTQPLNTWAGFDANGFGWYGDNSIFYNWTVTGTSYSTVDSFSNNDICAVAIDFTAGMVWFKNMTTGSFWNHSATANPATGVGGVTMPVSAPLYACISTADVGDSATVNLGGSAFTGTVPTGFAPYAGGNALTLVAQALSSAAASLARQGGKAFSAATTPTKSILHNAGKVAQATGTQVTTIVRAMSKALFGTGAQASSLTRLTNRITTRATAAQVASIVAMKAVAKSIAATAAQVSSLIRATGKIAQATGTTVAALPRSIVRTISATAAQAATAIKAVTKTHTTASVSVAALAIGTIARTSLTLATTGPLGALIRGITRTPLTSSRAPVASLATQRAALFSIQGAASALGSIARTTGKGIQGASAAATSLGRAIAKVALGTTSPLASAMNGIAHIATGAVSVVASVARATGKLGLRGNGAVSATLSTPRRLSALAQASASALGSIARLPTKTAQASVSTVLNIKKALNPSLSLSAMVGVVARVVALKNLTRTRSEPSRRWTLRKKSPRTRAPDKGPWQL